MLTFSPAIAEHEREDVTLPGDLSEAMDAGSAVLPAVKKDISTAGQSQGTKSSTVKASLGVDILGHIKKWVQAGNVAVITAVARSKKYIVTAQNGKGADISADVPVTKGVASRDLKVSATAAKDGRWCSKVQSRSPSGYRHRH